jgi:predicted amidohydrolase
MRIAVIQHLLRGNDDEDAVALANAAADATDMGAEVVVFPAAPVLADDSAGDPVARVLAAIGEEQRERVVYLNPAMVPDGGDVAMLPLLGQTALLVGDGVADAAEILRLAGKKPSVAILAPRSDNDLQAEAVAELALGLSDSLAGLVIIAECAGAEPGEPGHGGSAIIHLGEVVAEAMMEGDETLTAEFELPIAQPEPRELLPKVPSILLGRVAHHQGRRPEVEYPADLS